MFTGLVREVGNVASYDGARLVVESATTAELGDSIAIDGVCLTVVAVEPGRLLFDVVPETVSRVKEFAGRVNVEPALRAGDPLGGHQVQGHVDGTGSVTAAVPEGDELGVEALPDAGEHLKTEILPALLDAGDGALAGAQGLGQLVLCQPFVAPRVADQGADTGQVVGTHGQRL